jgi:hypothetical protein
MDEITIVTDKRTGMQQLTRHGQPMQCPWRSPFPVPGQLAGQVGIASSPCNSLCPFFAYHEFMNMAVLSCSGHTVKIEIRTKEKPTLL